MRKQINLVFITIIICTLLSCNKDEIVNSNGAMFGLLPLRSGNSWNYRRIWLDTNQTAIDTFNIAMTMYGPDTVGTFIGYGIQNFFWPFSISLFTNESDGLYAIDNPGDLPNPSPPPIQA